MVVRVIKEIPRTWKADTLTDKDLRLSIINNYIQGLKKDSPKMTISGLLSIEARLRSIDDAEAFHQKKEPPTYGRNAYAFETDGNGFVVGIIGQSPGTLAKEVLEVEEKNFVRQKKSIPTPALVPMPLPVKEPIGIPTVSEESDDQEEISDTEAREELEKEEERDSGEDVSVVENSDEPITPQIESEAQELAILKRMESMEEYMEKLQNQIKRQNAEVAVYKRKLRDADETKEHNVFQSAYEELSIEIDNLTKMKVQFRDQVERVGAMYSQAVAHQGDEYEFIAACTAVVKYCIGYGGEIIVSLEGFEGRLRRIEQTIRRIRDIRERELRERAEGDQRSS